MMYGIHLLVTPVAVHWHCGCGVHDHLKPSNDTNVAAALRMMQRHSIDCPELTFDERGIYDTYRKEYA